MNTSIKGVFFDLDGVIIDSNPLWEHILELTIDKYSLDTEVLMHTDGYNLSTEDAIKIILEHTNRYTDSLFLEIIEFIEARYFQNFKIKTALFKGITDVLGLLKNKSIYLALVSNSSKRQVDSILQYYDLADYFCDIITSNDVRKGKPDKEPYIKALQNSGLNKNQILVVEDSITGINSAQNADLDYIVVNNKKVGSENIIAHNSLLEYFESL